ncbi:MAG: DNA primase [Deltaproteobacteria bacterium GWA2_38_16]|nr:MAG: DNA primase [Deltaproteobacteria bacterium GWA2_38_16]OGQ02293.1 MAG: DNA primase [Deltaproteobacteria bacterium RIFCSPHIGHO2_02_FULL_38_15]OGQ34364.1 MAG: DNA primase [Deltaproteobacteria bacterium RIFCSPLOWO2_01_FULL_38_9]
MLSIPEDKINEVRDRASIVSIISHYVNLKKAGINYKGLCPFHSEKTPSFVVSEAKKIYHCFGCGKGGNVFTFLMEHAKLSFPETVQKLALDLGIYLPQKPLTGHQQETKQKKELFYKLNKSALFFFEAQLKKNQRACAFLKKRGMSLQTIEKYHLGYAPNSWDELFKFFKSKGVSSKDMSEIGLARFRDRIIFPLFDLSQRVLGFGGRSLEESSPPKYLNSSESLIYNKGEELYGLSSALSEIGKKGVILVEGYFDCLTLHQAGFKNAVATMGTALTPRHVEILKRFTDQFYVLFDGDDAGKQAAERSLPIFLQKGILPKIIELDQAKDPDEYLQKMGKEKFPQKIKSASSLLTFVQERIISRSQNLSSYKTKVIEAMSLYLKDISGIEQEEAIKKLADRLQIEEKWILKSLQEGGIQDQKKGNWKEALSSEYSAIELELIEFFVLFPLWLAQIQSQKVLDLLENLEIKDVFLALINQYAQKQTIDFSLVLEKIESLRLRDRLTRGVLEKENQGRSEQEWKSIYEECMKRLQKKYLENMEKQLLSQIQALEKSGEKSEIDQEVLKKDLLRQYQNVVKQKMGFNA